MPVSGATISGSVSKSLASLSRDLPSEITDFGSRNTAWLSNEIRQETPVGEDEHPTHLRDSYYIVGPTVTTYTRRFRVKTDVKYAPWVEWDTGIHGPRGSRYMITGKRGNLLRFFWKKRGKMVTARYVMHPGSKGAHMFAKGADALERQLPQRMQRFVYAESRKHGFKVVTR